MLSGFHSRIRLDQTSLLISTQPVTRATKRLAANAISYAEIEEDFDEDEENESYNGEANVGTPDYKVPEQTERKRLFPRTRHIPYTTKQLQDVADVDEVLIPIKVNFDLPQQSHRVTDFFLWNMNETVITPEDFAVLTCQDMDLPIGYSTNIASAIKHQVQEYSEFAKVQLPEELDLNVIVNLSVNLNKQLYEDKFEWDLNATELTPHKFARSVVEDLGLAGEFYPAIAHAVYEKLLKIKKAAIEGQLPHELDNLAGFGREAGLRIDQEMLGEEWAPTVETLSAEEIEKREIERERSIRRLKRESARWGDTALSDINLSRSVKRQRRRYDGDSPSQGGSPYGW
ncbi:chromatin structure-remodeling complex subunit Sfh1p [Trichomonascus vanleenenianus]|uniref:Sfh1p n=1 Tax=Trichomonascus vanleenenianus TaxID=2268995 RepID=UPI003ECAD512